MKRKTKGVVWLYVAVVVLALVVLMIVAVITIGRHRTSASPSPKSSTTQSPTLQVPALAHIFLIVDENKSYSEIVDNPAAPYINGLIKHYALATNYFVLFHPSLPNYIALTSGSNHGITDDRSPPSAGNEIAVANMADRIEASGRTWKEYAESMPSAGFAFDSGEYVTKHNPFVYYKDIVGNAQRCRTHVVPFTQLATDLQSAQTTPDFAFIIPNLISDMHDGPIATGDRWLARTVPLILGSEAFRTTKSVLIVTWDEGSLLDNHVATILVGTSVNAGYRSDRRYDHYALLHTMEAAWKLAPLTANDASAPTMNEFFAAIPTPN
jgi:hypothetical protein